MLEAHPSAMKSLSKENLIEHYRVLQQAYKGLAKDHAVGNSTPAALSPEDLEKKVAAQSSAVHKGTKKQMKWQVSQVLSAYETRSS